MSNLRSPANLTPTPGTTEGITEVQRQEALLKTGPLQNAILNSANFSSVGAESRVGVGSVFWFELSSVSEPLLAMQEGALEGGVSEAAAQAQAQTPRAPRSRTLLYVEDNSANRNLVEQIIARHPDISLLTAVDGNSGVEIARASRPDVILMDINLPDISGFAALKALREDRTTAHIPIIAVSAYAMANDVERGLKAGFLAYITKPIKVSEFMESLNVALDLVERKSARSE